MMQSAFDAVIRMSIWGTATGMIVLLLKAILQKIGLPRRIMFLMWIVIALRLACPVIPDSDFSALNVTKLFNEEQVMKVTVQENGSDRDTITEGEGIVSSEGRVDALNCVLYIWCSGMLALILVSIVNYIRLKKKLRFATKLYDNIYLTDNVSTAFVFGIIKPKIYIPESCDKTGYEYVIAHEKTHILRGDYITKILAYIVLSVHWFNPFVWIMFKLFSDDMEFTCDECTVLKLGEESKIKYIESLLGFAKSSRIAFYNVAFSTNPVKRRCMKLLKVRKGNVAVNAMALSICAVVLVILGTNATEASKINEDYKESVVQLPLENNEEVTEYMREIIPKEEEKIINEREESVKVPKASREKIVKSYSYKDKLISEVDNVYCDENGNISISFDMDTEIFVWIKLYETGSNKQLEGNGILAGESEVHVFTGLDKTKTYRIRVESPLGDMWKIEGSYTIY